MVLHERIANFAVRHGIAGLAVGESVMNIRCARHNN